MKNIKYYGYIQDSTKNDSIANSISLGYYSRFSDEKQKLIDHLVNYLNKTHSKDFFIQEEEDLLNGDNKFIDGWCQVYGLFSKNNLRFRLKYQICVWAINEDEIL